MVLKSALSLALISGLTVSAVAQTATNFDVLRGNAYYNSAFGNAAGAFTVADQIVWPHLMSGNKFLYVEPTNESGTVAWTQGSITPFFSLQNATAGGIGLTTIGFAKGDIGLDLSIAKNTQSNFIDNGTTNDTTRKFLGDMYGLNYSMKLGALALQANASYAIVKEQMDTKNNVESFYQFIAGVQVSNFPSAKTLFWFASVTFDQLNLTNEVTTTGTTTSIDPDSRNQIRLAASQGIKILGNEKSRVLIGAEENLNFTNGYDIRNVRKDANGIGFFISPNLVGEFALTDSWLFVGGAKHTIKVYEYGSVTLTDAVAATPDTDLSATSIQTSQTTASVGTRFQKGNFAAEVSISDDLFANGSSALFSGTGLLSTFGAFLNF